LLLVVANVVEVPQRIGDALNEAVTVGMIAGLMIVTDAAAVSVSPIEFDAVNVHVVVPTPPIAAVAAVVWLPVGRVPAAAIGPEQTYDSEVASAVFVVRL
jgi:hypothetical protein